MPDTFSIGGGYQQSPEYSEKLPLRVYQRRTGSLDTFSKGRPDKHRPVPRALRGIRQYVGSVATNCHKLPQGQMHSIRSLVDEIPPRVFREAVTKSVSAMYKEFGYL